MKKIHLGLLFTLVATFGQAQTIAAGWAHSLTICSDSVMQAFGRNSTGALGNGITTDSNIPVTVINVSTVFVTAAGFDHSMALLSDSTVWCWGSGGSGQLGNGISSNSSTPVQVIGLTGVVDIAAGAYHSLALKADGTVWCWGENFNGQLGNGTTAESNIPVQVSGLIGMIDIAGGSGHSLAAKSDGTVWGWGVNGSGTLGTGNNIASTTPIQAIALSGITQVMCGQQHSAVLKNDSTVWCFGGGAFGQNGNGGNANVYTPTLVSGISSVVSIAYGSMALHTAVIKADGTIWVWGGNDYGQLGDGTTVSTNTPAIVPGISGVLEVSAGNVHSIALKDDGSTWTWGWNTYGQLGNGNNTDIYSADSISGVCSPLLPSCNTTAIDVLSSCGDYTWIDGTTYSVSNNSAIYVMPNAAGCDSTITLDLTILNATASTDIQSECDSYIWIDGNTYNATNDSATYVLTNAVGCDSIITLDLTITTVDNTTSLTGTTISANMTGATYQWLDCDNFHAVLPGETNQSYTASANGNYAAEVTYNGCLDTSSCISIANIGISEIAGLEIYVNPNPSNGLFNIELVGLNEGSIKVHVLDSQGRLVLSEVVYGIDNANYKLDITEHEAGMYVLKIIGESGVLLSKRIIKK